MATESEPLKKKTVGRAEVIRGLLDALELKMAEGEMKATLGDYIRLIQIERELAEEEPKEIRLRWVDADEDSLSGT